MKIRNFPYYNQEKDVDDVFYNLGTVHYNVSDLTDFDENNGLGSVEFRRNERKARFSFNLVNNPFEETISWTFPPAYPDNPSQPFRLQKISERCFRLTFSFGRLDDFGDDETSPMLDGAPKVEVFATKKEDDRYIFETSEMTIEIEKSPFALRILNKEGEELTRTLHSGDSRSLMNYAPLPFSFAERNDTLQRYSALSLNHHVNEHFYGLGESFTHLDKSGQKITLWTQDPHGSEGQTTYKPVPFYMSSRGYGVFVHSGAAMTMDLGWQYAQAQTLFVDGDILDVFFFVGNPKEILGEYTKVTGKSPLPPLWSFGFWMSRITYNSEAQAREVAAKLKEYEIPCDVIHLDTGWFEEDWLCDFEFSPTRFDDPKKMLEDFRNDGYRVTLWQYPYFTPKNKLTPEILERGLGILNADGELPSGDAILDLSNPEAVKYYQGHLKNLFDLGISGIKVDFGEAAPVDGVYHSGKSGRYEHNLYPLRYNKAAADITREVTGDNIIWARSAWAGSQRYPIHWAGDTANTDMGMLASLRGGLSLGSCGFSFFSNDAGGFAKKSEEELYSRWSFMMLFTSHMRAHGQPPKEPWAFSDEFLGLFRKQLEFRYSLTPYVMAQAGLASEQGIPLQRSMYMEFPEDKNCYHLEDQYMFGSDILVAPIFDPNGTVRSVYLPEGKWFDVQSGSILDGQKWFDLKVGELNGIYLIRHGAVIPRIESALNTDALDWSTTWYEYYGDDEEIPSFYVYDPESHSVSETNTSTDDVKHMI